MGPKDISRNSSTLINATLDEDEVLQPGESRGPNSRWRKRMDVDINNLILQLNAQDFHYFIINMINAETLAKEQEKLIKELDVLDEIKEKIRHLQQTQRVETNVKLVQAQLEFLVKLKTEIERNIAVLDKKIIQLKGKINNLTQEIKILDRQIAASATQYLALIKKAFSVENILKNFQEQKFLLPDGKEFTIGHNDIHGLGEEVDARVKENCNTDVSEAASRGVDKLLDTKLQKRYEHLPERERQMLIDEIKAGTKFKQQTETLKDQVKQLVDVKEIKEAKEDLQGKLDQRASKEGELAKCEQELQVCEKAKGMLMDLRQVVDQAISSNECSPVVFEELKKNGAIINAKVMLAGDKVFGNLAADVQQQEADQPVVRHKI